MKVNKMSWEQPTIFDTFLLLYVHFELFIGQRGLYCDYLIIVRQKFQGQKPSSCETVALYPQSDLSSRNRRGVGAHTLLDVKFSPSFINPFQYLRTVCFVYRIVYLKVTRTFRVLIFYLGSPKWHLMYVSLSLIILQKKCES